MPGLKLPSADTVSAFVAVVGAVLVIFEYLRERRQRRLERAAELERRFDEDPVLRFACLCLDWGIGSLPTPSEYAAFVGEARFTHDKAVMYSALRLRLLEEVQQDPKATFYRQAFVALFNHLERVLRAWKRRQVLKDDLTQTAWVVGELVNWRYAKPHAPETWFLPALDGWYKHVIGRQSLGDLVREFLGGANNLQNQSSSKVDFR